jgi:tetratricopeptide (TPR) repeat protein
LTFLSRADLDAHVRLACVLGAFWTDAGLYREGLAWMTSALDASSDEPTRQRAEDLATTANIAIILDRYDEGFRLVDESLACSAAAGELPSPSALRALALAALVQGRSEDARRFAEEAIAVARESGDPYMLAATMAYVSSPLGMSGDDERGVVVADEAVDLARTLGNPTLLAMAVQSAGIIRSRIEPATAIELLAESFAYFATFPRRFGFPHTWAAVAHLMLRQYPDAARELCVGLFGLQESGEPYQLSIALAVAASVLSRPAPEVAIRVLAAIDRQRDDGRFVGAAGDLAVQAHLVGVLRTRLDPPEFDARWAEGRALTIDEAIAVALDHLAVVAATDARV